MPSEITREESLARRLAQAERGFEDAMAQRAQLLDVLKRLTKNDPSTTREVMAALEVADAVIARCEREVPRG